MHCRGLTRTAAIAAVALITICAFIYASLQPAIGAPDESRRVIHPSGFSVDEPIGWEHSIRMANQSAEPDDALHLVPTKIVGVPGYFDFKKLNTPADVATLKAKKYQPITFRGQPAWELFVDHPYTHEHTRSVIFNDAGNWYELMLKRPELESLTGDPWQAYFESAHTAAPATTKPSLAADISMIAPTIGPATKP